MKNSALFRTLGINLRQHQGKDFAVYSPLDGQKLAVLKTDGRRMVDDKIEKSLAAFQKWREVPAPKRGELIRLFGDTLRSQKQALARLVTLECGKIYAEALGEVQEMIDICDFAVGLSRQLYGLTMPSERRHHGLEETWLPLGPVAIISAFNFPVAVWAWNFTLAIVAGDSVIWKPSEKTPLSALACQALFERTITQYKKDGHDAPPGLSQVVLGDARVGEQLVDHPALALVSATGSTRMGQMIGPRVAKRFGRSLLELGGNNAVIVSDKADLSLALSAILFGAVGTAGQRCTTTRRVLVHRSIIEPFSNQLEKSYEVIAQHKIGNPFDPKTLVGPLIDKKAFLSMQAALREARREGGQISFGKRVLEKRYPEAYYVEPALVRLAKPSAVVRQETFAPILYVMPYSSLKEALEIHNDVPQGLSSAIFTTDLREAEYFKRHSDCGLANINIGTSGAEIGGAFGGEKQTGGGRESGSDAWKNYMRRQTSTTYSGTDKPALAQGIAFDVR